MGKKSKTLSLISLFVSLLIFGCALAVFITTLVARSQNRPAVLFGYSFALVVTDSMEPEICVGDLIIVKSCGIEQMKVGQNAVFMGLSGDYKDKCIVHKIESITEENGEISLVTKGVNNPIADPDPVTRQNFLGIAVFNSAPLGAVLYFLQQPINWLYILIIVVAIAVIITQSIKIIKYIKNKRNNETPPQNDSNNDS